jgi:hypothetical protein
MSDLSTLVKYAKAELARVEDPAIRGVVEQVQVDTMLAFAKAMVPGMEDTVQLLWEQQLGLMETAAFGDGKFLEQLIKLLELILPILLRILFPTNP